MEELYNNLIEIVSAYLSENEVFKVVKAYQIAEEAHRDQEPRESGEPYISHPLTVATLVASMYGDVVSVCAALLHDVVEDTEVTLHDIEKEFDSEISFLVDGLSKIKGIEYVSKDAKNYANTRKLLKSVSEDVRILIIKLADRLHNMRTLWAKKDLGKIRENALETLEVFVPLAEAIGAYKIKEELEDLSFCYLHSDEYQRLNDKLMILKAKTDPILAEMADNVTMCLNAENIDSSILSSYKNIYGVHIDLKNGKQLDGMHDLKALEVAVENSYGSCYLALGVIHQLYKPINHINDFLSNIKTNKYQAFHTTVFAPAENLVQARICTFDMANINTNGLMGFWNIHGDRTREIMQKDIIDKSPFFKSLREINRASRDDEDFVLQFREEHLSGNIYVYTPTGEVIPLPIGATPIDFAYMVHTELGNKITGAYVNGQEVSLFHKLQTRDIVKVVVNEEALGPTLDWLDNVKTSRARRKILEYKRK